MARPAQLNIESLERRDQPAVFGNPWVNADRLTLSFAADGVSYSNQLWGAGSFSSNLFSKLNGTMTTSVWQEEILRALYTWTSQANINIGLTPDTGLAFGSEGLNVTGASPADIRIGAIDQSPEVLATSIPYHPLTGNRAGNMMLNGTKVFTNGGANGTFDLYTVAMHEAANILGMEDYDNDLSSARNGNYKGPRSGLNGADVSAVQKMYGVRPNDLFEGTSGNNDLAKASALTAATDPANILRKRVVADGNITTTSDVDVYKFTTPAGTTSLTIRLGTAGKSLLAGKVEILDSTGKVLKTVTNTSPLQGDTVLNLTGVSASKSYYVRVSAGRSDAFAVGTYQLRAGFNYDPVTETKVDLIQRLGIDLGLNDSQSMASTLTTTAGFAANSHYSASGRIESVLDNDYYKFVAPSSGGVMTVSVQALRGLSASATVYSSTGKVVASNIVLNWEDGMYRAQVPFTSANATYYVDVKVQDPAYSAWTGDYFLDIDFKQPFAVRDLVAANVANQNSKIAYGFEVVENRAYSFALNAVSLNTSACNWFNIYIYDSTGKVVADLGTDGINSVDTLTVFLKKGKYTIKFVPVYNYASTATVAFALSAALISDPIDVYDPTVPPPPPTSPPFTTITFPPASPPPPGFYDPWSNPIP